MSDKEINEKKRRRIEINGLQLYMQNKINNNNSESKKRNIIQKNSIQETLYALKCQGILCDVTLVCENKEILAHRIILAMYSGYWEALFSNKHFIENQDTVYVDDVKYDILDKIIHFIYTNDISLSENSVYEIIRIADYYQINSLVKKCKNYLINSLSITNAFLLYDLTSEIFFSEYETNIREFIEKNWMECTKCYPFLEMSYVYFYYFVGNVINIFKII